MSVQYRLVVQTIPHTQGSEGLEWTERYYILQSREVFNRMGDGKLVEKPWQTIPAFPYESLSPVEQDEALQAHGLVRDEKGFWRKPE